MENHGDQTPVSGAPAPTSVSGSGANSSAVSPETIQALLEAIGPELDKRVQSTKDKRIAGLQADISDFQKQLQRLNDLKQNGWTEAQALDLMSLETREPQRQGPGVLPQNTGSVPAGQPVAMEPIIRAFGVDPNSPEAINAVRMANGNPEVLVRSMLQSTKFAVPAPDLVQGVPPSGGSSVVGDGSVIDMTNSLNALMSQPMTAQTMKEIKRLQGEIGRVTGRPQTR